MWEEVLNGKSLVVVHGKIEYGDIFGTNHWTTYCRYVLHPELISEQCTRYKRHRRQQVERMSRPYRVARDLC